MFRQECCAPPEIRLPKAYLKYLPSMDSTNAYHDFDHTLPAWDQHITSDRCEQ